MKNDITRKLTSLTLMTIMFAGGMTFAIPGALPQAAADPATDGALTVSSTEFGGQQILEIQINDPDIRSVDTRHGQPTVALGDHSVQMVQASSGIWYAYVGDDTVAGADHLLLTGTTTADELHRESSSDMVYFADGISGAPVPNPGGADNSNPAAFTDTNWPFVQLYDIDGEDGETLTVAYGSDTIDVTFNDDLSDSASVAFDRSGAPAGAVVHLTITDPRLNLDPTGDDTWTLTVNDATNLKYGDAVATELGDDHGLLKLTIGDFEIEDAVPDVPNEDATQGMQIVFEETGDNTGEFTAADVTLDEGEDNERDVPPVELKENAKENAKVDISYADNPVQLVVRSVAVDITITTDDVWSSGESATVTLTAPDLNLNTDDAEDITIESEFIPTIIINNPITIGDFAPHVPVGHVTAEEPLATHYNPADGALLEGTPGATDNRTSVYGFATSTVTYNSTGDNTIIVNSNGTIGHTFTSESLLFRFDTSLNDNSVQFTATGIEMAAPFYYVHTSSNVEGVTFELRNTTDSNDVVDTDSVQSSETDPLPTDLTLVVTATAAVFPKDTVLIFDILSFGGSDDDVANNAIYRHELEETDGGVFTGTLEYIMLNQINVDEDTTYDDIVTEGTDLVMIIDDEYTGNELHIIYDEKSHPTDILTNTGTITLDSDRYSTNSGVSITIVDPDLNTDNTAIDSYVLDKDGTVRDSDSDGTILQVFIEDELWDNACGDDDNEFGLTDAFELAETEAGSGTFTASFDVPIQYCTHETDNPRTDENEAVADATGKSIKVTYYDFRESGGNTAEVSDSATVLAVTGTVSLDRTVYPVPADADDGAGNVVVHIEINDPDHNLASDVRDTISTADVLIELRPVNAANSRDLAVPLNADTVTLRDPVVGEDNLHSAFTETGEDSGIFKETIEIPLYILGDEDPVEQSYVLTVEYTDKSDATGETSTATDSAIFNVGTASLSTDEKEYTINQKAFITLTDHDSNYDSETRETISLADITWEGSADTDLAESSTMFDPTPSATLRETEANSGIFLVEITIPKEVQEGTDNKEEVQRGERVTLSYDDISPAGSKVPGSTTTTVETSFTISRTGASMTLDKDVYSWRDRVTVTVIAPDANIDDLVVEDILINANSQGGELRDVRIPETGANTGIFQGTIDLGGYSYDPGSGTEISCIQDDQLCVENEDGFSVTYTYDEDERDLVQSGLIRWSVAEVTWLESSYREETAGTLRVVDPDRNLHPDSPDSISTVVFSDTYRGGIKIALTETDPNNGVFEGEVLFDTLHSKGNRLQVSEGDIVTAAYDDETLPPPDGERSLRITGTTTIGSIVPPLERVAVSNLGVVDALGSAVDSVSVGQQVNIAADLASAQSRSQDYAYLLQIQNMDGVTVHLSWAASSLAGFGGANVSQSWTPDETGSYTATVFVWESLTNPTALSPQNSIDITVV